MAFKSLNDQQRREALIPFLRLADSVNGWLVTFAISKSGGSLFAPDDSNETADELALWKPHIQERLMRVIHLSIFLLSGLSIEGQNIFWIVDQDAIAANTVQLTQLTKLVGRVLSHMSGHNMGHIRCGTTESDNGARWLEDLASISDLSCGSISEVLTAMNGNHVSLQAHVAAPILKGLSWKSRLITDWYAQEEMPLKRITCLLDLSTTSSKMKTSIIKWHTVPSLILRPGRI